jgi:hypothetical protein
MKVQSAGRLGNQLFQWAFALDLSLSRQEQVTLFSDIFHSKADKESEITGRLLSDDRVAFRQLNLIGLMLTAIDWISIRHKPLGRALKEYLKISDEWDQFSIENRVLRGYFQNSKYALRRKSEVVAKLQHSLNLIVETSAQIRDLEERFPKYQLIHVRLGDYVISDFGIVSSESYKHLVASDLPVLICTNGIRADIEKMVDFPISEILDSSMFDAWETLVLMQNAEIFIGVNSTLSWWGAFLANSNGNTAYLPDTWTKEINNNQQTTLEIPGVEIYKTKFI